MMKEIVVFIFITLLFVACGRETSETRTSFPADGKADGTLTINDKKYPLKYAYNGKKKSSDAGRGNPTEESWDIEVLVSTEPLSYETLSKIFPELERDSIFKDDDVLKGDSIKALYFRISGEMIAYQQKWSDRELNFSGMLITSDGFIDYMDSENFVTKFDQFDFADGRVAAKVKSKKWEETKTGEKFEEIKITAEFEVSFESQVNERSLFSRVFSPENKSWQQTLATLPDEGTAQGTATANDEVINVSHTYAARENTKGTGEVIKVLLTAEPIQKEFLMQSFNNENPRGGGLCLQIDKLGTLRSLRLAKPGYVSDNISFEATAIRDFSVENGRIKGTLEGREKSNDGIKWDSYTVSFDAPLK